MSKYFFISPALPARLGTLAWEVREGGDWHAGLGERGRRAMVRGGEVWMS